MDKKKPFSFLLARWRGLVQACAALLTNLHLPNFFKGELYRGAGKSEYVVRNQANIHRKVLDAVRTGDVKLICQTLLDHYMETTVSYLWEHGISAEEFPYKINFTL